MTATLAQLFAATAPCASSIMAATTLRMFFMITVFASDIQEGGLAIVVVRGEIEDGETRAALREHEDEAFNLSLGLWRHAEKKRRQAFLWREPERKPM